ncbi:PRP40 pre-mRNA processing factor 40 [Podila epigama]|nr:PRP40 pre-mRNA processing factor 40 [Podila epigama]
MDTSHTTSTPGTPGKTLWTEYTHQDGRKYYYHTVTKQTVWQKPIELKSAMELAFEASPWKEYTTPEGKKYYHNATTKETVWTVPAEYKELLDRLAEEKAKDKNTASTPQAVTPSSSTTLSPAASTAVTPVIGSQPLTPSHANIAPIGRPEAVPLSGLPPPASTYQPHRPPFTPQQQAPRPQRFQQSFVPAVTESIPATGTNGAGVSVTKIPEFATKEEAEKAFKNLLKETGVTSTWTWEQTMRAVVTNPLYRALKTTAERKTAFQEYVDERRIQEKQEEKAKQQKLRQDFIALLENSDKVTHASRYTTISRLFAEEPAFKAIEDDRIRYSIFDNHLSELIRKEKEEARLKRKAGMSALTALLQSIKEIIFMTRWAEAKEILQDKEEFKTDTIQVLNKIDQLSVYEDHIKQLEKEYDQQRSRDRTLRKRAERKRREAFKELLAEFRGKGQLNAKTNWMQIHPLIKDDPRYQDVLGQPGSNPMELFWDLIEDLDERLYQDRKLVQDVLKNIDYEIVPETTFEQFEEMMKKHEKTSTLVSEDLVLIFEQLLAKAVHRAKEEKRRQEKVARKKAESFRFMLKNLSPAVTVESTWDDVKLKSESTPEYLAVENDEKRKEIFDRYIERLKERIAKNQNSDDEDGSILEDDADYAGSSRKSGAVSSSPAIGSSADRKRGSSTNPISSSGSSKQGYSYQRTHHSHHHHSHSSTTSNTESHRRDGKESSSTKRPHGDERTFKGDNDSGSEGEKGQQAKKSKPNDSTEGQESSTTDKVPEVEMSNSQEEGEVVEGS